MELPSQVSNAILFRDFDFETPRDLVFLQDSQTGLGDFLIACDVARGLRYHLNKLKIRGFKFIGTCTPTQYSNLWRFFESVPIFDQFVVESEAPQLANNKNIQYLDAGAIWANAGMAVLGNQWNSIWAKWGLPGFFKSAPINPLRRSLHPMAKLEFQQVSSLIQLPRDNSYVVFCPESLSIKTRKAWPIESWRSLIDWTLTATDHNIVIIGSLETAYYLRTHNQRTRVYDHTRLPQSDLLKLASLIYFSDVVIGIDSGPVHVASLLGTPAIALFGPTGSGLWGHPPKFEYSPQPVPTLFPATPANPMRSQYLYESD